MGTIEMQVSTSTVLAIGWRDGRAARRVGLFQPIRRQFPETANCSH
jgi:hypothetical protein